MADLSTVLAARKFVYGNDPRSKRGIFARGKNVYRGASHQSQIGPRGIQNAAKRRVRNGRS